MGKHPGQGRRKTALVQTMANVVSNHDGPDWLKMRRGGETVLWEEKKEREETKKKKECQVNDGAKDRRLQKEGKGGKIRKI